MIRLLFVTLFLIATTRGAEWPGVYRQVSPSRQTVYENKQPVEKPTTNTFVLKLGADHGLTYYFSTHGTVPWDQFLWGAWEVRGDRMYYHLVSETAAYFGFVDAQLSRDTMVLSNFSEHGVHPRPTELKRVNEAVIPKSAPANFAIEKKAALDRALAGLPRTMNFTGAESEAELERRYRTALEKSDTSELLRLTFPTLEGLVSDYVAEYYFDYLSQIAAPGVFSVQKKPREEAMEMLTGVKKSGCEFPAYISPEGCFMTTKAGGGRGIFYGIVDGKWALIGSPLNLETVRARMAPTGRK